MTKSFGCSDAGVDCKWTTTADTEEEIMEKIKEHARNDHGFTEIPQDRVRPIPHRARERIRKGEAVGLRRCRTRIHSVSERRCYDAFAQ